MPFNVEEFKAQHTRNSAYLKTNRFHVRIPIPQILTESNYDALSTARIMEFYIQDSSVPGYDLVLGDVRRWSYGPNEKRPYSGNVNEMQLLINLDGNGTTHEFFSQWISAIMPHDITQGIAGTSTVGSFQNSMYTMSYKNEYATTVQITGFDEGGSEKIRFELIEAFPSNISNIATSWADQNQIAQFTVSMQYLDWTKQDLNSGEPSPAQTISE